MCLVNYDTLKLMCNYRINTYRKMGKFTQCTPNAGYTYIDNGSNVLAVAHIDTVQQNKRFKFNDSYVWSSRLDDRLGVYTILDLLPKLGITVDVLLTEDEELCNSTAQYFVPTKQYNYVVEFDRGGNDTVNYQYGDNEFDSLLEYYGFVIGQGSYTDICDLGHLDIKAFNIGVGYFKPHSINAFAYIPMLLDNLLKFEAFYYDHKNTKLHHYDPIVYDDFSVWNGFYTY